MPRWYGDNIKGSEFAKLRSKVMSVVMVGVCSLGYLLLRYGYPTQRKAIEEGWYDDDPKWLERKAYMKMQLTQMPIKMNEKRDIANTREYMEKFRAKDQPVPIIAEKYFEELEREEEEKEKKLKEKEEKKAISNK